MLPTRERIQRGLAPYLGHLRALPFVKDARVVTNKKSEPDADAVLDVRTPSDRRRVMVQWKRSHLSREMLAHIKTKWTHAKGNVLLLAPLIGRTMGGQLAAAGISYLDLAGNCNIQWGKQYVAHVEGRKAPNRAPQAKALRVPSLLVLFSLLARPDYVGASTRRLSQAAGGVSPQTATDLRKRLIAEGCLVPNGRDHFWAPKGKERALDLLVAGYEQLATHLRLGRFRARPGPIQEVERQIERNLEKASPWSWGGGAALYRRNRFYRGTQTIVYVDGPLPAKLPGLVPDPNGEVIFARRPGECAVDEQGEVPTLLIYLDLLIEGEPRALEAAQQLRSALVGEPDP